MRQFYFGKLYFFLLILFVIQATGCNLNGVSPKKVGYRFLQAMEVGDYQKAARLCTDSTRLSLEEYLDDMPVYTDTPNTSFMIMSVIEIKEGEEAIVNYLYDDDTISRLLHVRRENKAWRVHYIRTDPLGVAEAFLDAFHQRKFEKAKYFVTEKSKQDIDLVVRMAEELSFADSVEVTGIGFNLDKTKAIVFYEESGNNDEMKINLVLTRTGWKVAFSKFDDFELT